MSYELIETSNFEGDSVELWEFTLGTKTYHLVSEDEDFDDGSNLYLATAMTSPNYVRSLDMDDSSIEVKIDKSSPLATALRAVSMSIPCSYKVTRKHRSDIEIIALVQGDITGYDIQGGWMALKLESILSRTNGLGLRRFYSISCGHLLYGIYCKLLKDDFLTTAPIDSVASHQVTISALTAAAADAYVGGFLAWSNPLVGGTERAWITRHEAGGVLTLAWRPDSLVAGVSASIYEGCARTKAACVGKGNDINYGGFAYIPVKNPFGGTAVF